MNRVLGAFTFVCIFAAMCLISLMGCATPRNRIEGMVIVPLWIEVGGQPYNVPNSYTIISQSQGVEYVRQLQEVLRLTRTVTGK